MAPPPHWVAGHAVEYRAPAPQGANGAAYWDGSTPVVALSVEGLTPAHQWYVWAHEVCHIEGHAAELAADCCAARKMRAMGVPVTEAASAVQSYDSGPVHPPGPVRAATIIRCYGGER